MAVQEPYYRAEAFGIPVIYRIYRKLYYQDLNMSQRMGSASDYKWYDLPWEQACQYPSYKRLLSDYAITLSTCIPVTPH